MRISDWSSDVCSSDLIVRADSAGGKARGRHHQQQGAQSGHADQMAAAWPGVHRFIVAICIGSLTNRRTFAAYSSSRMTSSTARLSQIGRASCRERVGQYVSISGVAVAYKKKQHKK